MPLKMFTTVLNPLVWLVQTAGKGILKLLGLDPEEQKSDEGDEPDLERADGSEHGSPLHVVDVHGARHPLPRHVTPGVAVAVGGGTVTGGPGL